MEGKKNLLRYIKKFFHNLFKKQKRIESAKKIEDIPQREMIKKFREDKEIIELQDKYEKGKILEEDLSKKQKKDLEELYKKQIETLKQDIIMYKKEIDFFRGRFNN